MKKLSEKLPLLKKRKLSKKSEEKEDGTKIKLHKANQDWNDWKFQIHWNKLWWVYPRSHDELKNRFCVSSKESF